MQKLNNSYCKPNQPQLEAHKNHPFDEAVKHFCVSIRHIRRSRSADA